VCITALTEPVGVQPSDEIKNSPVKNIAN